LTKINEFRVITLLVIGYGSLTLCVGLDLCYVGYVPVSNKFYDEINQNLDGMRKSVA
jgi:hypothetical protein